MGKKPIVQSQPREESLGLWVDTPLVMRLFKQPGGSTLANKIPATTERLLHIADVASGAAKPDKFTVEKVSKRRTKSRF
jgi:hypothetical protein